MITSLAASGQTAFAASASGLMRSLDQGRSWHSAFTSLNADAAISTSAVALSPQFATHPTVFAAISGAILRSSDGGDSWEAAQLPTPYPYITTVVVSPFYEHDRTLFAASFEDGVFRSTDGGAAWNSWNFGLLDFQILSLATSAQGNLLAGTGTGLFTSRNAGRLWREILLPCGHVPILSLASSPNHLLIGTETQGLYVTQGEDQNWQRIGVNDLETVNVLQSEGASILAVTPNELIISRDSGQTWQKLLPSLLPDELPTAVCAPAGLQVGSPLIVGGNNGSVTRLTT